MINGRARVTKGGAPDLLNRLIQIYVGPEAVFPLPEGTPPEYGYITHITAERIHGYGSWDA